MPYTSEAQRRFMALVHAVQQGKVGRSKVSKSVLEVADSMTAKQTEDFMKPAEDVRKTSSAEARHTTAIQRLLELFVPRSASSDLQAWLNKSKAFGSGILDYWRSKVQ